MEFLDAAREPVFAIQVVVKNKEQSGIQDVSADIVIASEKAFKQKHEA